MNTNAASVTRNRLAAVDASTGLVTSFNPNVNGTVNAVAVAGATVYTGGSFSAVNGSVARSNLAAFTGGIADAQFAPTGGEDTTYYYRVVASSAAGSVFGAS
jgi:hypothetical protein